MRGPVSEPVRSLAVTHWGICRLWGVLRSQWVKIWIKFNWLINCWVNYVWAAWWSWIDKHFLGRAKTKRTWLRSRVRGGFWPLLTEPNGSLWGNPMSSSERLIADMVMMIIVTSNTLPTRRCIRRFIYYLSPATSRHVTARHWYLAVNALRLNMIMTIIN